MVMKLAKSNTEILDYYQEFLRRLIAVILTHEPGAADRMLTVIRSGASDQDIFRALLGLTIYREVRGRVFI
jgi:Mg2+/Co2+ transporter CorC